MRYDGIAIHLALLGQAEAGELQGRLFSTMQTIASTFHSEYAYMIAVGARAVVFCALDADIIEDRRRVDVHYHFVCAFPRISQANPAIKLCVLPREKRFAQGATGRRHRIAIGQRAAAPAIGR